MVALPGRGLADESGIASGRGDLATTLSAAPPV
jgi:hypothetical protein